MPWVAAPGEDAVTAEGRGCSSAEPARAAGAVGADLGRCSREAPCSRQWQARGGEGPRRPSAGAIQVTPAGPEEQAGILGVLPSRAIIFWGSHVSQNGALGSSCCVFLWQQLGEG